MQKIDFTDAPEGMVAVPPEYGSSCKGCVYQSIDCPIVGEVALQCMDNYRKDGRAVIFHKKPTGATHFPNKAGDHADTDGILRAELKAAGILTFQEDEGKGEEYLAEFLRKTSGEVKTSIRGTLHGWVFTRNWYYWVAKGPGIEASAAEALHAKYGNVVRVDGDGGCPNPIDRCKGLSVGVYHVDTQEGLKALADTIKGLVKKYV